MNGPAKFIAIGILDSGWLAPIAVLVFVGLLFVTLFTWLDLRIRREIRSLTDDELAKVAFEDLTEYFNFIGTDNEAVQRYLELTEKRDIEGLCREWSRLATAFVSLERKAGHRDRPLLMDYGFSSSRYIKAFRRRTRSSRV
ncbi:MAG TPA: hypothetical protein DCY13_19160 [Verrucomicrobiales bacterium]|nr:hypothetical protein [Verrucomicrobiales bacterium]